DTGAFGNALRRHLQGLGAVVRSDGEVAPGTMAIACPDGPDLSSLETFNQAAHDSRRPWIVVLRFGDGVVTGPVFAAAEAPCFRCFERRWLGLSPCITL